MEAICSSETSVDFQWPTRRYIREYSTLPNDRCENVKSYMKWWKFEEPRFYSQYFKNCDIFCTIDDARCRSQWSHGLSHEPSSSARTLGSWVPVPLEAWMSVCVYSVFVLFCVQVATLRRADPPSKESYRLYRLRNWKSSQAPQGL
jgi:hypothetical protein